MRTTIAARSTYTTLQEAPGGRLGHEEHLPVQYGPRIVLVHSEPQRQETGGCATAGFYAANFIVEHFAAPLAMATCENHDVEGSKLKNDGLTHLSGQSLDSNSC